VLLHEDEYDRWFHGSLDDVEAFQARCFPDELIVVDRTTQPWSSRRAGAGQVPSGAIG
jgi:hypothetical protein